MRYLPLLSLLILLAGCSGTPESNTATTPTTDTVATTPFSWTGYYTGTLPCTDCPGIETSLWVRSDSTFVLQQQRIDRDSLRTGMIGHWHIVNDLITTGANGDKPDFWHHTENGLMMVDEMGEAFKEGEAWSLEKLADAIGDAIPRMRLTGTFTYMADAQSFQPCGATYNWPCVGGMDMGEEEGEPLVEFTNVDLQKAYLKAVKTGGDPWVVDVICTLGMGPAMEGDGADEYIFIEQVIGTAVKGCP
jgi:uncharacterized lipoprotein NlpE involved in copper resistance